MVSSEVFDDKKLNNINQNLKLKDLDDYDLNLFYEYDDSLSVEDNVVRKFILKEKGKSFKKHLYDDAIDFYKKLIDNSYFVNDYYPYRHLAITYNRTKQPSHLLDTIKKFFKSGIYANTCQVNWFLYKLRDLESQNLITNDEIDELLEYYENHGFLNKHKENEPTVLADRIFQRRNGTIEIDTQYGYDKQQHKYEIKEKGRWLERCNLFEDALELYWEQVQTTATGASDYYQRLAIIYERMHEFENELYVLTLFYKQRYHIVGKSTKKYFQNRLDKVNQGLRTSYTVEDFLNDNVNINNENDNIQVKSASNDELLFNDGPSEPDIPTKFNDNSFEQVMSNEVNENHLEIPFITIAGTNLTKLLKRNVADIIIVQYYNDNVWLEIVDIHNPNHVYKESNSDNLKFTVIRENFEILKSLNEGELITIKSKWHCGKVILKLYDDEKSTKDIGITSFKKQIEDGSTIYKESPVDKHVNETSKSTVKYILNISLPDKYELDLDNPFGFDSNLSDEDNIKMKFILKDNGNYLTKEKLYDDAIEYYGCLKNNSYFENDWYPYRQLAMIFEKKGKHEENIENIKQLFFSGIYCNGYQYIWFIHKLNNALVYVEIEESEIGTWLDYYNEHGAKNENKLDTPIFIADRIVKQDNKIKVYSKQMFYNNYQKLSEFKEKVRFSEQIGDYESALEAIRLYYQEYYSKIAHKDTMWFRRKLKIVNKELGTNYNYTDFIYVDMM